MVFEKTRYSKKEVTNEKLCCSKETYLVACMFLVFSILTASFLMQELIDIVGIPSGMERLPDNNTKKVMGLVNHH